MLSAKVRSRKRALDGSPVGRRANQNPILDIRAYNVEFADGQTAAQAELSAKQCDRAEYVCDLRHRGQSISPAEGDRSSPKRRTRGPTRRHVRPARIESPLLLNDKGLATLCQMERWKHFMGTTRGLEGV
ncbi:hypothetical protein MHU86_8032 [Fragilaria crotonensis]|nr:hypothetical protein MHU86_8032 [Fragilaria crotonensis]